MEVFDAAIIGGGTAGAAAALSLRQLLPQAAISVFESCAEPRWKPGEILSPRAEPLLKSLGVLQAFHACGFLPSHGTRAAWGSNEVHDNDFLFSLHGHGWRLDRARFDSMLRGCAEARGLETRFMGPLRDSSAQANHWRLHFRDGQCEARFVIDATGRSAAFAVQRGAQRLPDDRLAGAFAFYQSNQNADTLIEAVEHGWWYSASIPGRQMVAAFMTDTDIMRELRVPQKWNELLAPHTRARLGISAVTPKVFTAHSQVLSQVAGPGWAAAGDAAMTFDPLSSQGIVKALRSAKLASFVAADFLNRGVDSSAKYQSIAFEEYKAYKQAKGQYYALEQRWPGALFWQRRRA